MKRAIVAGLVCGGALLAGDAQAQMVDWTDKGFLSISGGVQTGSKTVSDRFIFGLYREEGAIDVTRKVGSGPMGDVTGGVRVWKNLAVAVSVSGRARNGSGDVVGKIPHPTFFGQPRDVSATLGGMKHKEIWGGVLAAWVFPITEKVDVTVMGGPAVVRVQHELASGVSVQEATVPGITVSLENVSKSVWGGIVGVDGRYMITSRFGIGAFARYAAARVNLSSNIKLDVGGFQAGGGLRVRF